MTIVKVEWEDAHTCNRTLGIDDIKKELPIKAITIGYLINENEKEIAICGFMFLADERDDEDGFRDTHLIPKSLIKKITKLRDETNNR